MSNGPDDNSSTSNPKSPPQDPNLVDTVASPGGPATRGLQPGNALGSRYTILKILGRGGMGIVYQAWDAGLGVPVAIKMILPWREGDESTRDAAEARFKREILLARSITHKNVVRIHDFGEFDGHKYVTMPFVEGETLAAVMRRTGPMPVRQVLALARQIADGLRAAHDAGVVHRDLKPENVMVTPDGQALILDFGIARANSGGATQSGIVMGTLEYMAPEQAGGAAADHRTDLYALGLILYDMLAGRQRLSRAETPMSELLDRARYAPPGLRSLRPDLSEPLERIVMNCIQPESKDRFATTAELNDALTDVTTRLMATKVGAHVRRTRSLWLAAAAAVVALGMGVAGWIYFSTGTAPATRVSHPPMSMILADFENRTGDPLTGHLVEESLWVGVESAAFINLMPRFRAMNTLGLNVDATLDVAGAKRVAIDEGVDVVLSGKIERSRNGYRIRIQGEPGKVIAGRQLFEIERDLPDDDRLLLALGQLAAEIRATLGDQDVRPSRIPPREMFSFASLHSALTYVSAVQNSKIGRRDAAIKELTELTAVEPTSARAWALLATQWIIKGDKEKSKRAFDEALNNTSALTDRELLRMRGLISLNDQNAAASIAAYEMLLDRFPGDSIALNNLALATFNQRDFARAYKLGETAAQLYSNSAVVRINLALYAMYSGDFAQAQRHAQQVMSLRPDNAKAPLAWALSTAATGAYDEARAAYERLDANSPVGRYFSAAGIADLDLLAGRPTHAALVLERAIASEALVPGSKQRLMLALAEARLAQGRTADSGDLAVAAAQLNNSMPARFVAVTTLLAANRGEDAVRIAAASPPPPNAEVQMMAKLIDGHFELARKNAHGAVARFKEAVALADSWLAHFALGRAYLETGAFADAQIEFDQCLKRRGEATSVFLDDIPTLRMIAPTYYYQGLARSAMKLSTASESFRTFLAFKEGGDEKSPMIDDARKRSRELR